MGRGGGLRDVELVDPAVEGTPEPSSRPPARRRLWLGIGAAGVVLALGVTQWVVTAREDAAVARLTRLPGVLSPVDDTLEVVRRLTPGDAVTLTGRASGALLRADDGSQSYRWFEPAGGEA